MPGIKRVRARVLRPGPTKPPKNSIRDYVLEAFLGGVTVTTAIESLKKTLRPSRNAETFRTNPDKFLMWHISTMLRLGMLEEAPTLKRPRVIL